jgi:hypothetical protein
LPHNRGDFGFLSIWSLKAANQANKPRPGLDVRASVSAFFCALIGALFVSRYIVGTLVLRVVDHVVVRASVVVAGSVITHIVFHAVTIFAVVLFFNRLVGIGIFAFILAIVAVHTVFGVDFVVVLKAVFFAVRSVFAEVTFAFIGSAVVATVAAITTVVTTFVMVAVITTVVATFVMVAVITTIVAAFFAIANRQCEYDTLNLTEVVKYFHGDIKSVIVGKRRYRKHCKTGQCHACYQ